MDKHLIEEWRDINGYEGLYQISSHGRVRSYRKPANPSQGVRGGYQGRHAQYLYGSPSERGYVRVQLWKRHKGKWFKVHRLVAIAFIPKPDRPNLQINHKDCNKQNNRVENLEWVTHQENDRHATANRLKAHGARHPHAKLKPSDIAQIRRQLRTQTKRAIARKFGVSVNTIYCIAKGMTWAHVGSE